MKFAKYWEKIDIPVNEKLFGQSEISVWGASNDSPEQAQDCVNKRALVLKKLIDRGFDNRDEYEYSNGYIKEEILEEIKSDRGKVLAVLTRNSYGAAILNTEIVLFGDIDLPKTPLKAGFLGLFGKKVMDKNYFLEKIENYQKNNSALTIKVYETFAGLRFVITNAIYNSEDASVIKMFADLDVDPLYANLCKRQKCFRARLTPKPWRIGLDRPGSRFPRSRDLKQNEFNLWLKSYTQASSQWTTVKLLKTFGSHKIHSDVQRVLEVHDRYACKTSGQLA